MRILLALFIGLSFYSCKKGTANFTIKGTITDATFSQPLTGASVNLYEVPTGSNTETLVSSMTLGADGAYKFIFPRDKMDKYILRVDKANYFNLEETIYFSSLTIEKDNERDYSTTAKAWVRLRFVNQNPVSTDELDYVKQQGKISCAECCPTAYQYLYGAIDTAIYCINDGNTTYSYYYSVFGTSVQGIKSVTTTAFDTSEILLTY